MNAIVSGVIFSAAMMRSPSFSRSSSSTTTTNSPRAIGGDGVLDLGRTASSASSACCSAQETFDVLGEDVDFEVDRGRRAAVPERRDRERVRDHRDGERRRRASAATVRLMPSTVIEPLSHDVAQHRRRARRSACVVEPSGCGVAAAHACRSPSTWPCTRWPPSRSARRTGRSRFTGSPGAQVAEGRAGERLGDRVGGPARRRRARRR